MTEQLRCPVGHAGPWRYVEAIEVWRSVEEITPDDLVVDAQWHTGEGYDDGLPGTAYLVCWARSDGIACTRRVEVPADLGIIWQ